MSSILPISAPVVPIAGSAYLRSEVPPHAGMGSAVQTPTAFLAMHGVRRAGLSDIAEGFATMQSRFKPDEAGDMRVRMQFVLTGPGGGSWFVVIKNGRCTVTRGTGSSPDTTLTASAADYLKITNGEMNKLWALVRGKLRVSGDMGKVRPFFKCFEKQRR